MGEGVLKALSFILNALQWAFWSGRLEEPAGFFEFATST